MSDDDYESMQLRAAGAGLAIGLMAAIGFAAICAWAVYQVLRYAR